MVNKTPKRKKREIIHHVHMSEEDARTEKILIENFVALQKVMTHLSERFDNLSMQISKMLNLFEISAKALAEKEFNVEKDNKDVKKMAEKIDGLLEQNKTIAKGLLFLHEELSTNKPQEQIEETSSSFSPSIPTPTPISSQGYSSSERYQKSISSGGQGLPQGNQLPRFKPLPK